MSTGHDTSFAEIAGESLLDRHGESVTYSPDGGDDRAVLALIDRDPRDGYGERSAARTPVATVTVLDRTTSSSDDGYGGVGISELDIGAGETITYAVRKGETPQARPIKRISEQGGGMLVLLVT